MNNQSSQSLKLLFYSMNFWFCRAIVRKRSVSNVSVFFFLLLLLPFTRFDNTLIHNHIEIKWTMTFRSMFWAHSFPLSLQCVSSCLIVFVCSTDTDRVFELCLSYVKEEYMKNKMKVQKSRNFELSQNLLHTNILVFIWKFLFLLFCFTLCYQEISLHTHTHILGSFMFTIDRSFDENAIWIDYYMNIFIWSDNM